MKLNVDINGTERTTVMVYQGRTEMLLQEKYLMDIGVSTCDVVYVGDDSEFYKYDEELETYEPSKSPFGSMIVLDERINAYDALLIEALRIIDGEIFGTSTMVSLESAKDSIVVEYLGGEITYSSSEFDDDTFNDICSLIIGRDAAVKLFENNA